MCRNLKTATLFLELLERAIDLGQVAFRVRGWRAPGLVSTMRRCAPTLPPESRIRDQQHNIGYLNQDFKRLLSCHRARAHHIPFWEDTDCLAAFSILRR